MKKFNLQKIIILFSLAFYHFSFSLTDDQQLLNGKKLYEARCSMCHGADAKATGFLAQKSNPPTPDLTSCVYQRKLKEGAVVSSVVLMPAGTLIPDTLKHNGVNIPNKVWTSTELSDLNKYVLALMPKQSGCFSNPLPESTN